MKSSKSAHEKYPCNIIEYMYAKQVDLFFSLIFLAGQKTKTASSRFPHIIKDSKGMLKGEQCRDQISIYFQNAFHN